MPPRIVSIVHRFCAGELGSVIIPCSDREAADYTLLVLAKSTHSALRERKRERERGGGERETETERQRQRDRDRDRQTEGERDSTQ